VIHAYSILVLGVVGELHALVTLTYGKQPKEVLCVSCVLSVRRITLPVFYFVLCEENSMSVFVWHDFEYHYMLVLNALL
jgi:hypothetical protein